jgi:dihydroflavonol-4-reductase
MQTAVTGASGYLGGAVVRALLAEGRLVRAIDLHRGATLDGLDVEFVQTDILDPDSLDHALGGVDVVYHLAAMIAVAGEPTDQVWKLNVDRVRNVAQAALRADVSRVVHCSSVHAYDLENVAGVTEKSPRTVARSRPIYDRSKAAGEEELRSVIEQGLDAVIVNPTGVIGPLDYGPSRMGHVFTALFTNRLPAFLDAGFDWVDLRDVASSMIEAERSGATGENYLLPGHHATIPQLAELASDVSSIEIEAPTIPMWVARAWSPLGTLLGRRSGNPLWYTADSLHALRFSPPVSGMKASKTLGHSPRPLPDSVKDIYEWFVERGALET